MAQLVEQSPPTPEICGSIPVIGNFIYVQSINQVINSIEKMKIKEKLKHSRKFEKDEIGK